MAPNEFSTAVCPLAGSSENTLWFKEFSRLWKPPVEIANSHDLCVSIYRFFNISLNTGKQTAFGKKAVGITLAASVLLGAFALPNPVGWVVGGLTLGVGGIYMAAKTCFSTRPISSST